MKKLPPRRKFTNSLALVRAAVGLAIKRKFTSDQFAKLLGIPGFKLRAIEIGRERISEDLAKTVMLLTGVSANSLRTNRPKDLFGKEYSEESFLEFWKMSLNKDGVTRIASQIQTQIDILVSAANETGTIFLVLYSLAEWLKGVVEIRRVNDIRRLKSQIQTMIGDKNVQSWTSDFFEGIERNLVESDNLPAIRRLVARLFKFLPLDEPESQEYAVVTRKMMQEALAGLKSSGDRSKDKDLLWQRIVAVSAQGP